MNQFNLLENQLSTPEALFLISSRLTTTDYSNNAHYSLYHTRATPFLFDGKNEVFWFFLCSGNNGRIDILNKCGIILFLPIWNSGTSMLNR